ncbi:bifunctional hydroxymethylpyrimidine kinase/phosphomethylpyrimidine kinase [Paraglaciecola sp.]|uniref:bifunctional hydroxymethylpyrimidine kinase/phosphomethylpyrimidine kinase n=1 Tax=Paraglaciecola sp. TaxID=1920173 RepID=UPI0030F434EA
MTAFTSATAPLTVAPIRVKIGADSAAVALTIAGSDSGGGAGIQADIKSFSALGVYATSVITALTAQNTLAVTDIHEVPEHNIAAQLAAVFADIRVDAVKIGMLSSAGIIATVADGLRHYKGPVILDPVMVAKSGDMLLRSEALNALRKQLLPMATLLTPNLPEAAILLNQPSATTVAEAERQGRALLDFGVKAVLMKGGHFAHPDCTDLLIVADQPTQHFNASRIATRNTHGTGCTFSASIAACMARGMDLASAVETAKAYLHQAIVQADELNIGTGHGPVHHFHNLWVS